MPTGILYFPYPAGGTRVSAYQKRVYLHPLDGDGDEEPWMRFRLVYEGPLRASQPQHNDASPKAMSLASHKHAIRRHFHKQLKHLWETDWFLSNHTVHPKMYGVERPASDNAARFAPSPSEKISLLEAVAHNHREHGYRFVPLVRKDWRLICSIHIVLLRHDVPNSAISAGDLDNRVKTLIDAMRKPSNLSELYGHETPGCGEDPFYCLLEDDKYITGFAVESDRLLKPPDGSTDEDRRQVLAIIQVEVRPYDVTQFNLSFS